VAEWLERLSLMLKVQNRFRTGFFTRPLAKGQPLSLISTGWCNGRISCAIIFHPGIVGSKHGWVKGIS